jgi:ADP-ribosylation factor-like protein 2
MLKYPNEIHFMLSLLRQIKEKEKEVRILILGLDNAGKTTVVKRLCGEPIDTIEPTLGFQIQTLPYKNLLLNLWDVGGQKSIRAYWRNYFEQTDGLIWVVDSSDLYRLELCRDELAQLLSQERLAGASVLVYANKQDVDGALSVEKISQILDIANMNDHFKYRHWKVQDCSAVTGEGLTGGIDWIVDDISSRIFMLS